MKKTSLLFTAAAGFLYISLSGYQSGPGVGGAGNRTGSSTTSITDCSTGSGCHGGNNTSTTMSLTLMDVPGGANTAAGRYIGGQSYIGTLHVQNPAASKFGFQLTAAKAVDQQAGVLQPHSGTSSHIFTVGSGAATITGLEHNAPLSGSVPGHLAITFSWTAPMPGTGPVTFYSIVNAVNGDGFADASDHASTGTFVLSEQPASVADLSKDILLSAYPNPFTDKFTISFNDAVNGEYTVRVMDVTGRKMHSQSVQVTGSKASVSVESAGWSSGLYFAQVVKDGAQRMLPIVKK